MLGLLDSILITGLSLNRILLNQDSAPYNLLRLNVFPGYLKIRNIVKSAMVKSGFHGTLKSELTSMFFFFWFII